MGKAFELLSGDLSGKVVVWTGVAGAPGATWGEILSVAAAGCGAVGVLVDGAVRDGDDMTEVGVPVYAARRAVVGPNGTVHAVEVDVPVAIGDVEIRPGDTIVLDSSGCIRASSGVADELLAAAVAYAEGEGALLAALAAGEPLTTAYLHKKQAVAALRR